MTEDGSPVKEGKSSEKRKHYLKSVLSESESDTEKR